MSEKVDVSALRAVEVPATPGPWTYREELRANQSMVASDKWVVAGIVNEVSEEDRKVQRANAAFICAARNNWTALLDEVARLRRAHVEHDGLVAAAVSAAAEAAYQGKNEQRVLSVEETREILQAALAPFIAVRLERDDLREKLAQVEEDRNEWRKKAFDYKDKFFEALECYDD